VGHFPLAALVEHGRDEGSPVHLPGQGAQIGDRIEDVGGSTGGRNVEVQGEGVSIAAAEVFGGAEIDGAATKFHHAGAASFLLRLEVGCSGHAHRRRLWLAAILIRSWTYHTQKRCGLTCLDFQAKS